MARANLPLLRERLIIRPEHEARRQRVARDIFDAPADSERATRGRKERVIRLVLRLRGLVLRHRRIAGEGGGVLLLLGRAARGEAGRGNGARRHEVTLRRGRCQTVPNPRVATADACDVTARGVHE